MRLPADAALIAIDAPAAEAAIDALLALWRAEGLPVVHVRRDGGAFEPPLGEPVVLARTSNPFAGGELEPALDAFGATTLVLCGATSDPWLAAGARAAAARGYRVFVVAGAGLADAPSLARQFGEDARVVSLAQALAAGAGARLRQRLRAARQG